MGGRAGFEKFTTRLCLGAVLEREEERGWDGEEEQGLM